MTSKWCHYALKLAWKLKDSHFGVVIQHFLTILQNSPFAQGNIDWRCVLLFLAIVHTGSDKSVKRVSVFSFSVIKYNWMKDERKSACNRTKCLENTRKIYENIENLSRNLPLMRFFFKVRRKNKLSFSATQFQKQISNDQNIMHRDSISISNHKPTKWNVICL